MARVTRWADAAEVPVELVPEGSRWFFLDAPLRDITVSFICREQPKLLTAGGTRELLVHYFCRGYNDLGSTYDPENSHPPEHEDEREVKGFSMMGVKASPVLVGLLLKDLGKEVEKLIYAQELPGRQ